MDKQGGTLHVLAAIAINFVHGLPCARLGGQVNNGVNTGQRRAKIRLIGDGPPHKLKILRARQPIKAATRKHTMDLRSKSIKYTNSVPLADKYWHQMRPDEAGTTGYQYCLHASKSLYINRNGGWILNLSYRRLV